MAVFSMNLNPSAENSSKSKYMFLISWEKVSFLKVNAAKIFKGEGSMSRWRALFLESGSAFKSLLHQVLSSWPWPTCFLLLKIPSL